LENAIDAVKNAVSEKGVRVIIFEAPCVNLFKAEVKCAITADECKGCGLCRNKLGCPAISMKERKAEIDKLVCNGCGLCFSVCPFGAIKKERLVKNAQ
jgi:indolepyruvate ferredoxin oxidoreductase alpha subunit